MSARMLASFFCVWSESERGTGRHAPAWPGLESLPFPRRTLLLPVNLMQTLSFPSALWYNKAIEKEEVLGSLGSARPAHLSLWPACVNPATLFSIAPLPLHGSADWFGSLRNSQQAESGMTMRSSYQ